MHVPVGPCSCRYPVLFCFCPSPRVDFDASVRCYADDFLHRCCYGYVVALPPAKERKDLCPSDDANGALVVVDSSHRTTVSVDSESYLLCHREQFSEYSAAIAVERFDR